MTADQLLPDVDRCQVQMVHPDKTEARCILHRNHQQVDADHVDEHDCHAPVLISQATLREVERVGREWPDGIHTCAELQRTEPGRRPCTCGRCPSFAGFESEV